MIIIKKFNMAIKVIDNIIYAYDIEDNIIREETEGILKEVNLELADAISKELSIKKEDFSDYNVAIIENDLIVEK